jgi:hypothetical protein
MYRRPGILAVVWFGSTPTPFPPLPAASCLSFSIFLCVAVPASWQLMIWWVWSMDQISIKTPNPKCRLYWCLIEFIDWGYSKSCWYFRPLWWTSAHLTFSLVHLPPPPPFPVWIITGVCIHTVCNRRGRGSGVSCRQVPLLVNFWEKPTFRVWCLYRYLVHGLVPGFSSTHPSSLLLAYTHLGALPGMVMK